MVDTSAVGTAKTVTFTLHVENNKHKSDITAPITFNFFTCGMETVDPLDASQPTDQVF